MKATGIPFVPAPRSRARARFLCPTLVDIDRMRDWNGVVRRLRARDLRRNCGASMLARYYGSPSALVMACGPRVRWQEW